MRGIISDPLKEQLRREKISEARKQRKLKLGYINSPETREKIGNSQLGRQHSDNTRLKMSLIKRGKKPDNFEEMQKKAWQLNKGRIPANFKTNDYGYSAIHGWVRRHYGKASKCLNCNKTDAKRYEWSNISREYKRDINDWEQLCVSCHRKKGFINGEYHIPWKGKKVYMNTGRTWIKKGQHLSLETEFKRTLEIKET